MERSSILDNYFIFFGSLIHILCRICLLIFALVKPKTVKEHLSIHSQFLYLTVFLTRYLDIYDVVRYGIVDDWIRLVGKILLFTSSFVLFVWMLYPTKKKPITSSSLEEAAAAAAAAPTTEDDEENTNKDNKETKLAFYEDDSYTAILKVFWKRLTRNILEFNLVITVIITILCSIFAYVLKEYYGFEEYMWTFSQYVEAFALIPQFALIIHRLKTSKYILFGYLLPVFLYCVLYIFNWLWKYYVERLYVSYNSTVSGVLQLISFILFVAIYTYQLKYKDKHILDKIIDTILPQRTQTMQITTAEKESLK